MNIIGACTVHCTLYREQCCALAYTSHLVTRHSLKDTPHTDGLLFGRLERVPPPSTTGVSCLLTSRQILVSLHSGVGFGFGLVNRTFLLSSVRLVLSNLSIMNQVVRKIAVSLLLLNGHRLANGFISTGSRSCPSRPYTSCVSSSTSSSSRCENSNCRSKFFSIKAVQVTAFPEFQSKEEYDEFLRNPQVSALPKGFSCGSAVGSFISVEAPAMGNLPIKATVIALDQPTGSWAACFTKNKVNSTRIFKWESTIVIAHFYPYLSSFPLFITHNANDNVK